MLPNINVIRALAFSFLLGFTLHAGHLRASAETLPRIIPIGDWKADSDDVQKVLNSTARELWKYFPDRALPPIIVQPQGGPIALFKRGENGEIRVRLNTGKLYWSQYAYQFSHEFCHILCNYDDDRHGNKWFEESLCEMASIYTMRAMSRTWRIDPPYPNWKGYATALKEYADDVHHKDQLPRDTTFVEWFQQHREQLSANATNRANNRIVARQLLPLFEQQPKNWEAVTYLNKELLTSKHDLETYLGAWRRNSPPRYRAFIQKIAAEFEIRLSEAPGE